MIYYTFQCRPPSKSPPQIPRLTSCHVRFDATAFLNGIDPLTVAQTSLYRQRSIRLLRALQKPLHNPLKHPLPPSLNHIAMTRHDPIEVKLLNLPHALPKTRPISSRNGVPNKPLLPHICACVPVQSNEQLREDPCVRIADFRVLFRGWQIEDEVGFDESLGRFVAEDEFLVRVGGDVFNVEFGVEGRVDFDAAVCC